MAMYILLHNILCYIKIIPSILLFIIMSLMHSRAVIKCYVIGKNGTVPDEYRWYKFGAQSYSH